MTIDDGLKKGLNQFAKDVLYSALVSVSEKALRWTAVLLVVLIVALTVAGWTVPAWTLAAMAVVAFLLVYLTKRVAGREARELRPKLDRAEDKLDRHDSYGRNLCSVLDTFQKIIANDINLKMEAFIERGILIPARDVMQENGHPSDLRMSVLLAEDGHFSMVWASGHHLESQKKFKVSIEKTISQVAYEKKVIQTWKNAPEEERGFVRNPKATRGFKTMVSIPILEGDETRGVFNVVTEKEDAFDPADISYLTSLGSILQLAFGLAVSEIPSDDATTGEMRAGLARQLLRAGAAGERDRSAARRARRAPEAGVGSVDTAENTGATDE